jgi:hypothetical protein
MTSGVMRGKTVRRDEEREIEERDILERGIKGDLLKERPAGGLLYEVVLGAPGNGGNSAELGPMSRPPDASKCNGGST